MKFGNLLEICLWPHLAVEGLMELLFAKGLIHISPWPLVTKDWNNGLKLLLSSNTINSLLESWDGHWMSVFKSCPSYRESKKKGLKNRGNQLWMFILRKCPPYKESERGLKKRMESFWCPPHLKEVKRVLKHWTTTATVAKTSQIKWIHV